MTDIAPSVAWYGAPCGHSAPQAASQLHGICIFCWRDRGAAAYQSGIQAERERCLTICDTLRGKGAGVGDVAHALRARQG